MHRLRLISIEGLDGAGKSTLLHSLGHALDYAGYPYLLTHEPYSKSFEAAVLGGLRPEAEALAFAADRLQHISEIIAPALAVRKFVIIDRYIDSSFAYQGYGGGVSLDWLSVLNRGVLEPGLTYFLDVPPEQGLKRQGRKKVFEERGLNYIQRVQAGYQELIRQEPDRFAILSGCLPLKDVAGLAETDLIDRIEGGEFGVVARAQ